jgi:tetratricopeptide (TPR) repeat protein
VNLEDEESRKRVWELLESIPSSVEYHVEILRRRIEFVWIDQEFNDLPKGARWARALVEAEPFDVKHWWWLADIIGRIDGESAAVAIVREGIERHGPDFSLYYELAALLCSLGQLVEAKEAMILALKEDPCANESALEGECFTLIHDFIKEQQARDCYKKAISSDLAGYHLS